jgi:putative ABC transport system substrate-binding protein
MGSMLEGKRLELLHELVPKAAVIAVLIDPNYPAAESEARDAQEAAARRGVTPLMLTAGAERDIDAAFASLVERGAGALLVTQTPAREPARAAHRAGRASRPARNLPIAEYAVNGGSPATDPISGKDFARPAPMSGRFRYQAADLPVLQPTTRAGDQPKTARASTRPTSRPRSPTR